MSLESKIEEFLNAWGTKLGESANKALSDAVNYSTGQPPDIQFDQSNSGTTFSAGKITYRLALNKDYWRFIESGVDGLEESHGSKYKFKSKRPIPQKAAMKFLETRAITFKSLQKYSKRGNGKPFKKLSYEAEKKTLSFIIGRSIKKYGIKPRPFVDKILTKELNDELIKGLGAIMASEVVATFKTIE